ncbi:MULTISPECIES: EthD family reductase [Rhodococcus]|uniref:Ethyl tert-butyl ether degradation EthD n=1 Tax=Rhodococcus pyridinivorans AK37 TaxID=1114960 RepID=H0JUD9_9NOCA|nr:MULTISPECIES: EthD family reductase [Rhodococcus]EHK82237.1 Ethyl tert-butyl ether degradation EthD [Rhodococcus pyridinivorans AK37]
MHDVIVLYNHPEDRPSFDQHYASTHVHLVHQLPGLIEFTWGKVDADNEAAPYYVIARMTFADAQAAADSFGSPAGTASVEDLDRFAGAGVTVLHVPRAAAAASEELTQ